MQNKDFVPAQKQDKSKISKQLASARLELEAATYPVFHAKQLQRHANKRKNFGHSKDQSQSSVSNTRKGIQGAIAPPTLY